MILTVCLSPCTDITIELDSLNVGKTNIVKSKTLSFTGKALNVAIGVARLGGEPYATGLMYNENGYTKTSVVMMLLLIEATEIESSTVDGFPTKP